MSVEINNCSTATLLWYGESSTDLALMILPGRRVMVDQSGTITDYDGIADIYVEMKGGVNSVVGIGINDTWSLALVQRQDYYKPWATGIGFFSFGLVLLCVFFSFKLLRAIGHKGD